MPPPSTRDLPDRAAEARARRSGLSTNLFKLVKEARYRALGATSARPGLVVPTGAPIGPEGWDRIVIHPDNRSHPPRPMRAAIRATGVGNGGR